MEPVDALHELARDTAQRAWHVVHKKSADRDVSLYVYANRAWSIGRAPTAPPLLSAPLAVPGSGDAWASPEGLAYGLIRSAPACERCAAAYAMHLPGIPGRSRACASYRLAELDAVAA